ncbi:MAG: ABC transporter ATP-binding protein [Desulfopila sp.]|nr:ABC transporter ATP-binding protein [Desulfopila sp.]
MAIPIIEIHDLCFSYSGKEVLHNINLTIHEKDFVAVIGPNGGGKTTLVKLILGLLKPTRGVIKLAGKPLRSSDASIGYVPQQIDHNLSFPATALDIVLMGKHTPKRRFFLHNSRSDRRDATTVLEQMGIAEFADRKITDLSGGQRQRVLIARALVTNPDLLVLDEPTASIDTKGQTDFYNLLKTLNRERTIFMVSHDLMTISSYAKSIACVNKRLHYHQTFETSTDLLNAYYSCSVEEICPVSVVSSGITRQQSAEGERNA